MRSGLPRPRKPGVDGDYAEARPSAVLRAEAAPCEPPTGNVVGGASASGSVRPPGRKWSKRNKKFFRLSKSGRADVI